MTIVNKDVTNSTINNYVCTNLEVCEKIKVELANANKIIALQEQLLEELRKKPII